MRAYKKKAIKAALELQYPEEVVEAIKNAKTQNEVIRILTTARKRGN